MNSAGPSDVSPEAMQARIQQARREAETLKDRIKRKKDELADTTRMSIDSTCSSLPLWLHPLRRTLANFAHLQCSARRRSAGP
jgi:hypothetical protein